MPDTLEPDLDKLVAANREFLIPIAKQVAKAQEWSLSLRCAVINASQVPTVVDNCSVGGVGAFIRTSTVIDHPLMERFLSLIPELGSEAALDAMVNDEADGEEFCALYDCYVEERDVGQLMWGAGDATEFVMKSQDCFKDREMACIAVLAGESQPEIYTFAVPLFTFGL